MITQRPIQPNHNFTYRFDVAGQEGTLWWHAHDAFLRGTVHGALIIRPRHGAASYPFPRPHREVPIIIGSRIFIYLIYRSDMNFACSLKRYARILFLSQNIKDLYRQNIVCILGLR